MVTDERVTVYWDDAWFNRGSYVRDTPDDKLLKPFRVETMGWLVREDAAYIVVALDQDERGDWRGVQVIPKVLVTKIEVLKVGRTRTR